MMRAAYFCASCANELTRSQVMYSDGCCPLCGNVSTGTVVEHFKRSVYRPPIAVRAVWPLMLAAADVVDRLRLAYYRRALKDMDKPHEDQGFVLDHIVSITDRLAARASVRQQRAQRHD